MVPDNNGIYDCMSLGQNLEEVTWNIVEEQLDEVKAGLGDVRFTFEDRRSRTCHFNERSWEKARTCFNEVGEEIFELCLRHLR